MAHQNSLADDLAYMKTMAEQGRTAPLVGGRFGLWWGVLTAAVLLGHWLVMTGRAGVGPNMLAFLWIGYGVIGGLGTWALDSLMENPAGASSVNNRLSNMLWSMIGLLIGIYTLGVFLGVGFGRAPVEAFDTILGVAFASYTVVFYAVGRFSRDRVMLGFAALSALAVLLVGLMIGRPELYLAASAFVLLTAGGSGVYQIVRAPRATV